MIYAADVFEGRDPATTASTLRQSSIVPAHSVGNTLIRDIQQGKVSRPVIKLWH